MTREEISAAMWMRCPHCGSGEGVLCYTESGKVTGRMHADRAHHGKQVAIQRERMRLDRETTGDWQVMT